MSITKELSVKGFENEIKAINLLKPDISKEDEGSYFLTDIKTGKKFTSDELTIKGDMLKNKGKSIKMFKTTDRTYITAKLKEKFKLVKHKTIVEKILQEEI